jgi:hypothetical protein
MNHFNANTDTVLSEVDRYKQQQRVYLRVYQAAKCEERNTLVFNQRSGDVLPIPLLADKTPFPRRRMRSRRLPNGSSKILLEPLTLVFADEDSARLESAAQLIGLLATRQSVKQFNQLPVEPSEGFLLDPIGDHPAHDVLGEPRRRDSAEGHAPALAQRATPRDSTRSTSASIAAESVVRWSHGSN